ncbi:hypothetical protein L596_005129 [Steinernema carpocapsae]|uniref:Uncharacterized protein n=1 Tax=Steinernema carpocapsae TaxID=34508 RepID=A0A4U8UY92_STECR|nr:hypothetical protein L596_005129 [Steinernema carpocapsae]
MSALSEFHFLSAELFFSVMAKNASVLICQPLLRAPRDRPALSRRKNATQAPAANSLTISLFFYAPRVVHAAKCKYVAWVVFDAAGERLPSPSIDVLPPSVLRRSSGWPVATTSCGTRWCRRAPFKGHRMIRAEQTKSYAPEPANNK